MDTMDKLKKAILDNYVTFQDNEYCFIYDTDDNTIKENETEFFIIQSELEKVGLKLIDAYIEHDCITGIVVPMGTY